MDVFEAIAHKRDRRYFVLVIFSLHPSQDTVINREHPHWLDWVLLPQFL